MKSKKLRSVLWQEMLWLIQKSEYEKTAELQDQIRRLRERIKNPV